MEFTLDEVLIKAVNAHKAGQIQEARGLYTAVLNAQSNHPDANHNMGVLTASVGKAEEALPLFKIALEVNPNIVQYWLSYIDCLIKLDRISDARVVFDQAKGKGVNSEEFDRLEDRLATTSSNNDKLQTPPSSQLQSIINLFTRGQLQQALFEATEMLERFPTSATLYNISGASNAGLMQFEAAIESYKKAIKIKPDYAEAYNNMGVALKEGGDPESAITSYKAALKIKPDYAGAYNNMGIVLQAKGDPEAALDNYKQALNIKPDYAEAYNNLGITLQAKGEVDAAIGSYKQALKINPNYAEAHNALGIILNDKGELEGAIESLQKALDLKPDFAQPHKALSSVFKKLSNVEKYYDHYVHFLELASIRVETSAEIKTIIPKLANKIILQNGVPTFFDNAVINQLTGIANSNDDVCEIFEKGELSKQNRFVSYSNRINDLINSVPQGRLFDGLPFLASSGVHSAIKWKEFDIYKTTFDLALYWMMIQEIKPHVIIELGSGSGGSAIWLADMALALGLETHVYSFDLYKPEISHDMVTFVEFDLTSIKGKALTPYWDKFIGTKLVIEDAHVNLKNVLSAFDRILEKDDYLIIEDSDAGKHEIIADFADQKNCKYKLDQFYLDFFGTNITCSSNAIFKVF